MTPLPQPPFADRRETALSRMANASMLLPAASVRYKSGDSEYRYRPDSELWYLTGWKENAGIAMLRGHGANRRFVLFAPEPDPEKERWTGPRLALEDVKARFEADAVYPLNEFGERAPDLLAAADRIHYRLGSSPGCDRAVAAALRAGRTRRARKGTGAYALIDPGAVLDPMRVRKDATEIARLRAAAQISVAAFREALGRVRPGAGEWEIEAALESGFRRRGADGPAFATIVAAGANACTLHYAANGDRIGAGDLVVIDAGAELDGYAADITRTVPAAGAIAGARRDACEIVREAHRAALAACRAGATIEDVHDAASRAIAEGLVGMGVLDAPVDKALEEGAHRAFFPHQTSHWLGLDTHDAGSYRTEEGPVALEAGMAFTVEPGLYFPTGGCDAVPELEGTGIRLEDDVLIAENGVAEVLTGDLPVAPDELAGLLGTAS